MARKRRFFLIRKTGKQYKSFGMKRYPDPVTGDVSICVTWPGGMCLAGWCSLVPGLGKKRT